MPFAEHARIVALSLIATLAGCAGNGAGLDANGNPIGPGGGVTQPLTADFKSIQDNVFTPICTKCHVGAGAPEGLQLDAAHSYSLLVGVPSTEQPNVMRVAPGDPDSSYLVLKLQGTPGITGAQMPLGGPYLPQSTLDVIRQWITDGAADSTSARVAAAIRPTRPFSVVATSPDDGSVLSMIPPTIVVAFSAEIDSTLLNATTVTLERSAPAGARLPLRTAIPRGNPAAVLIEPREPLAAGSYRVTLRGSLADLNARPLGADYVFTFAVDPLQ